MANRIPRKQQRFRDQLFIRAVLLVFALAFGAVLVISVYGIATELGGWYKGRHWQQGAADIAAVNLHSASRKSTSKMYTSVRYHYQVQGVAYTGQRLGWSDSMQVGSWHKRQYLALVELKNQGKLAPVWYDPSRPSDAVLDRGLRWGLLVLFFPLGLLFGAVSAAFLWAAVRGEFKSVS